MSSFYLNASQCGAVVTATGPRWVTIKTMATAFALEVKASRVLKIYRPRSWVGEATRQALKLKYEERVGRGGVHRGPEEGGY